MLHFVTYPGVAYSEVSLPGVAYSEVRRPCRLMLLVNPNSGRGQAMYLFTTHIQRMLTEADVLHTLVITEHQNHARELVREADLTQWDALVILSGDGLLFEVVNGLMEREDWEEAIQTPLGILPGGSGNALAASVSHYSGSPALFGEELLVSCGLVLCKGLVSPLDLVSVHLGSGSSSSSGPRHRRLFSFLSLAWGFVADVDIESERYRQAGAVRFLLGTLVRLASLRVYRGRLAYLPAVPQEEARVTEEDEPTTRCGEAQAQAQVSCSSPTHSASSSSRASSAASSPMTSPPDSPNASFCSSMSCGPTERSLTPRDPSTPRDTQPAGLELGKEHSDSNSRLHLNHNTTDTAPSPDNNTMHNASNNAIKLLLQPGSPSPPPPDPHPIKGPPDTLLPPLEHPVPCSWTRVPEEGFILVLAMCQSHLAEDLMAAPEARSQDGCIHLYYVLEGVSRATLLRLFLAMEKGGHMAYGCPQLVHRRVRALRLEPLSDPPGVITVDGEQVDCGGAMQAQIHPGLGRLVTG
ncbi:sphingosine kinase 1-like isoform X2 [Engraulis encrasicolus]|uniref:sphingosine kinase 1-like isoform X2 n=1 Tax=Engraulis encrasicolus TaxID=184585 RepID=UPI002FD1475C